ncbi:MAG: hypothetical protein HKL86_07535, partial [Acidimicrobiaceae bacterium]|nr:hypothetical protein [Acidimicrobiaceae bacterium]
IERDQSSRRDLAISDRASLQGAPLRERRRRLQLVLGLVWLIDAALQFQPYMFTRAFVTAALEPTASGNPWLFSRPMLWADHLMIHHIAWWNTLFALIQLLIGLGLLWRPTVRLALALSIIWGVAVWWFAEGFGGVFSGASPLSGAPGAVLLYVIIAVLVWPTQHRDGISVGDASMLGSRGAAALWVLLWGSFALFFVLPVNRTAQGLHDLVAGLSAGEPRWMQSLDSTMASVLNGRGLIFSIALALVCVAIALALQVESLVRTALVVTLVFAIFVWLSQDFGGVFTSQGTDVNSGPLIALLAWTYWPCVPRSLRG